MRLTGSGPLPRSPGTYGVLAASLVVLVAAAIVLTVGDGSDRPDVLIITIDSANRDHFSCYGYERNTTPHLCSVAAEGVRFRNAFAPSAETPQTLTAIHTGRHAHDLGLLVNEADDFPARNVTTIADGLGDGHDTHLYTGISLPTKLERSFDTVESIGGDAFPGSKADAVVRALGTGPAYVHLHFHDVHRATVPGGEDIRLGGPLPRPHVDAYDRRLAYVDRYVGAILDRLRRHGIYQDMFIVVAGSFGERLEGPQGHSFVHPDVTRIPLLIKPVDPVEPRVSSRLVTSLDMKPTVLMAAGSEQQNPERSLLHDRYDRSHVKMFVAGTIIPGPRKVWMGVADRTAMIALNPNGTTVYRFNRTSPADIQQLSRWLDDLRQHILAITAIEPVPPVIRTHIQRARDVDLEGIGSD